MERHGQESCDQLRSVVGSHYEARHCQVAVRSFQTKYKNCPFNRNPMGRTKSNHTGRSGLGQDSWVTQGGNLVPWPKRVSTLSDPVAVPDDSRSHIGGAIWWLTQYSCGNAVCVSRGLLNSVWNSPSLHLDTNMSCIYILFFFSVFSQTAVKINTSSSWYILHRARALAETWPNSVNAPAKMCPCLRPLPAAAPQCEPTCNEEETVTILSTQIYIASIKKYLV
jgi:hypothetical protein